MQQIQRPTSRQGEQNQFLSNFMEYQSCPFCQRSFFRGKLAFHLKLCNQDNPMTKNNLQSPKQKHKKNALSAATHYQRCQNCKSRIPSFMIGKHYEKCIKGSQERNKSYGHIEKVKKREYSKKIINNSDVGMEQTLFPRIKNYSSKETPNKKDGMLATKNFPKTIIRNTTNSIKIRQQLRCFKQAEEVQKVECDFCGRKFAEKAALRHVPICSMLRKKQQKQIALSKKSKNSINNQPKFRVSKTFDLATRSQQEEEPIKQKSVSIIISPINNQVQQQAKKPSSLSTMILTQQPQRKTIVNTDNIQQKQTNQQQIDKKCEQKQQKGQKMEQIVKNQEDIEQEN